MEDWVLYTSDLVTRFGNFWYKKRESAAQAARACIFPGPAGREGDHVYDNHNGYIRQIVGVRSCCGGLAARIRRIDLIEPKPGISLWRKNRFIEESSGYT